MYIKWRVEFESFYLLDIIRWRRIVLVNLLNYACLFSSLWVKGHITAPSFV